MAKSNTLNYALAALVTCGVVYIATRHSPTTWEQEFSCATNHISSKTWPKNGAGNFVAGLTSMCP